MGGGGIPKRVRQARILIPAGGGGSKKAGTGAGVGRASSLVRMVTSQAGHAAPAAPAAPALPSFTYPTTTITYVKNTLITSLTTTTSGATYTAYSITPALPTGLVFDTITGLISGTPTVATTETTYTITGRYEVDKVVKTSTTTITIRINDTFAYTNPTPSAYTINTAITVNSPTVVANATYSPTTLSAGLNINAVTGAISGTPSVAIAQTTYTITRTVNGIKAIATITIQVNDVVPLFSYVRVLCAINTPVTINPKITTGTNVIYSTDLLPAGLRLNSTTGVISGTPTGPNSPATNYAIISSNIGNNPVTINVNIQVFIQQTLNNFYTNAKSAYSDGGATNTYKAYLFANAYQTTDVNLKALIAAGNMFAILANNANVDIPNFNNALAGAINVASFDNVNADAAVAAAVAVAAVAAATKEEKATAAAAAGKYAFGQTFGTNIYNTVFNSNGNSFVTAGAIYLSLYSFLITPAFSYTASPYTLSVGTAITNSITPTITSTVDIGPNNAVNINTRYSVNALPSGLTLDTATGVISGTPTVSGASNYTITGTNGLLTGTATISITVNVLPTITQFFNNATSAFNTPYNAAAASTASSYANAYVTTDVNLKCLIAAGNVFALLANSAGDAAITAAKTAALTASNNQTVVSTAKNAALESSNGNAAAAAAYADAYAVGLNEYTIDSNNTVYATVYSLTIFSQECACAAGSIYLSLYKLLPIAPTQLSYTSSTFTFTKDTTITVINPSNTGGYIASYSSNPALPAGLSLNATTGVISGTPTAVSLATNYTITGTNTGGSSTTATISIKVNDKAPIFSYANTTANVGTAVTITPTSTGGTIISCSINPTLPAGWSLSATGAITIPATAVVSVATSYTIIGTNTGGNSTATISITVNAAPNKSPNFIYNGTTITGLNNGPGPFSSFIIPNTVTDIGDSAFLNCGNIGTLTFETGSVLLTIGNDAFNGSTITGGLTIPKTVTSIGAGAFLNCGFGTSAALANLYINCNPTVYDTGVGRNAFLNCFFNPPIFTFLSFSYANTTATFGTEVNITPNNIVGQIDSYSITPLLPSGLTLNTSTGVIYGTPTAVSVSTIYTITGTNTGGSSTATITITVVSFNVIAASDSSSYLINGVSNATLNVIRGQTYTFNINAPVHPFWIKTLSSTETQNLYISTGLTNNGTDNGTITFVVPYDAPSTLFYNCQHHLSMAGNINVTNYDPIFIYDQTGKIINGVSNSGRGTFNSFIIPPGVTSIGNYAFNGCSITGGLTIPKTVTSIGDSAFFNCGDIGTLTFETDSVLLTIGSEAFNGCSITGGLTIPKTVTSIGNQAFNNCRINGTLTFETGSVLSTIGEIAFYLCTITGNLTIPNTVTSIGSYSFYNCGFGTSDAPANLYINCSQGVYNTGVGRNAFLNCFFNPPIFSSAKLFDISTFANDAQTITNYNFVPTTITETQLIIPYCNASILAGDIININSNLTEIYTKIYDYYVVSSTSTTSSNPTVLTLSLTSGGTAINNLLTDINSKSGKTFNSSGNAVSSVTLFCNLILPDTVINNYLTILTSAASRWQNLVNISTSNFNQLSDVLPQWNGIYLDNCTFYFGNNSVIAQCQEIEAVPTTVTSQSYAFNLFINLNCRSFTPNQIYATFTHELGHALGIGSNGSRDWVPSGNYLLGTAYPNALTGYNTIKSFNPKKTQIPLEPIILAHWAYNSTTNILNDRYPPGEELNCVNEDIMIPFLDLNTYITQLSLQYLVDIKYVPTGNSETTTDNKYITLPAITLQARSITDVSTTDVSTTDVSTTDVSTTDVSTTDVSTTENTIICKCWRCE